MCSNSIRVIAATGAIALGARPSPVRPHRRGRGGTCDVRGSTRRARRPVAGCTYLPGQSEPLSIVERNQSMGIGLALGLLGGAAIDTGSSALTSRLDAPLTVPLGMLLGARTGAAVGYNAYQVPPGCIPGQ